MGHVHVSWGLAGACWRFCPVSGHFCPTVGQSAVAGFLRTLKAMKTNYDLQNVLLERLDELTLNRHTAIYDDTLWLRFLNDPAIQGNEYAQSILVMWLTERNLYRL